MELHWLHYNNLQYNKMTLTFKINFEMIHNSGQRPSLFTFIQSHMLSPSANNLHGQRKCFRRENSCICLPCHSIVSSVTLSVCLSAFLPCFCFLGQRWEYRVCPVQLLLLPYSWPGQTPTADEWEKLLFKLPEKQVQPGSTRHSANHTTNTTLT